MKKYGIVLANFLFGSAGFWVVMVAAFGDGEKQGLGLIAVFVILQLLINYSLLYKKPFWLFYVLLWTVVSDVILFICSMFFMNVWSDTRVWMREHQMKQTYIQQHPVTKAIIKEKENMPQLFTLRDTFQHTSEKWFIATHYTIIEVKTPRGKPVAADDVNKLVNWMYKQGTDAYYLKINYYDRFYPDLNKERQSYILTTDKQQRYTSCVPVQSDVCQALTYQTEEIMPFWGAYSIYINEFNDEELLFDSKKSVYKNDTFYLYFNGDKDNYDLSHILLLAIEQMPELAKKHYHIEVTDSKGKK